MLLLLAILAAIALYKLPMSAHTTSAGVDGGYYASVAQHVSQDRGLSSHVSILHQGAPELPYPTAIYPAWPFLWGQVARFWPLLTAGIWLATSCYFAALLLGYAWASSFCPEPLFPHGFPGFNAGHLLVLALGLNPTFLKFTSLPYTEGLTYVVLFAALLRFQTLWREPGPVRGLEMGFWLGLASLTRSQMLLLAMATFPVLLGAIAIGSGRRGRLLAHTLGCIAGFCLVLLPFYLHLRSFLPEVGLRELFRFDQVRYSTVLKPFRVLKESGGLSGYVRDRLGGLPIAFALDPKKSYAAQFFYLQYGLLLAAPYALWSALSFLRRQGLAGLLDWLRRVETPARVAVVLLALGGWLSTQTMHKYNDRWYFQARQALPCVLLFVLANVYLLRRPRSLGRGLAATLIAASVVAGGLGLRAEAIAATGRKHKTRESELVRWLREEDARRGDVVVAMQQPQRIAYLLPQVGFHAVHDITGGADLEAMANKLGVRYLVMGRGTRNRFAKTKFFRQRFVQIGSLGGSDIYELDGKPRDRGLTPGDAPTEDDDIDEDDD